LQVLAITPLPADCDIQVNNENTERWIASTVGNNGNHVLKNPVTNFTYGRFRLSPDRAIEWHTLAVHFSDCLTENINTYLLRNHSGELQAWVMLRIADLWLI
jgi:hypothetical protein